MNQPVEEQQDCIKEKKTGSWSSRKKCSAVAVIAAALALLAVPVLAWLYLQRSMETMAKINMPYAVRIGAGDTQPIQQLELSNIDVSAKEKSKDVVFCVYSSEEGKEYYLHLAHTTNIGFQYEIYKASKDEEGEISYLGKKYKKGEFLKGAYLNQNTNTGYATEKYHEATYGNYHKVQTAAEPLYWKSTGKEKLPAEKADKEYYVNYYILHITWGDTVQNNKETDMIYLMAGE